MFIINFVENFIHGYIQIMIYNMDNMTSLICNFEIVLEMCEFPYSSEKPPVTIDRQG